MPSIHSVTVHRVPFSSIASTTVATLPGRSIPMVSDMRITRAVARRTVSPSESAGSTVCVSRQGREASTSSPYQQMRFVSRWRTSRRRYLPATNSCVETCALTMVIPR